MTRGSIASVLMETLVILIILGLLGLAAAPKYWDTRAARRKVVERSMAAAVRSEIFAYHVEVQTRAKQLVANCDAPHPGQPELLIQCPQVKEVVKQHRLPCEAFANTTPNCWPAALDQAGIGAQGGLFSIVLRTASTQPEDGWTVIAPGAYRGPYGGTWMYNGMNGTFLCRGWCP